VVMFNPSPASKLRVICSRRKLEIRNAKAEDRKKCKTRNPEKQVSPSRLQILCANAFTVLNEYESAL